MKQKRRKLSMKVKDGLGPACPTCALPMQRWKHDPKWKPPARYYGYWYECLNAACKTKQVMPPEVKAGTCEVWMRTKNTSALPSKHLRSNTNVVCISLAVLWRTMTRQESVAPRHAGGRTLLPTPRTCRPRCVRQRLLEPFAVPGRGL